MTESTSHNNDKRIQIERDDQKSQTPEIMRTHNHLILQS